MLVNGGVVAKAQLAARVCCAGRQAAAAAHHRRCWTTATATSSASTSTTSCRGTCGVEVTVSRDPLGERTCICAPISPTRTWCWKASPGARRGVGGGVFEFDVVKGDAAYPIELQNVKPGRRQRGNRRMDGDRGRQQTEGVLASPTSPSMSSPASRPSGKVRPDGVWDVTAKGPAYDGRDLFRIVLRRRASGRSKREGATRASICKPR